jgi:hypothetical protein
MALEKAALPKYSCTKYRPAIIEPITIGKSFVSSNPVFSRSKITYLLNCFKLLSY